MPQVPPTKKKKQTAPHIHTEVRYIRNESLVQIRE